MSKTLEQLLKDCDVKVTFDPYRDITKGCGDHCKGMNKARTTFCENHWQAILRGDYFVKGGNISEHFSSLTAELEAVKAENQRLNGVILSISEKSMAADKGFANMNHMIIEQKSQLAEAIKTLEWIRKNSNSSGLLNVVDTTLEKLKGK